MFDLVTVYILIGLAHWASHTLGCESCQNVLGGFLKAVLEGTVYVFGWPFTLIQYLVSPRQKQEELKKVQLATFSTKPGAPEVLFEVEQKSGESDDDFKKRLDSLVDKHIEAVRTEQRNARHET